MARPRGGGPTIPTPLSLQVAADRATAVDSEPSERTVDTEQSSRSDDRQQVYEWIADRAKFDDAVARDASIYNSLLLGRLGRLNVELLVNLVCHINAM